MTGIGAATPLASNGMSILTNRNPQNPHPISATSPTSYNRNLFFQPATDDCLDEITPISEAMIAGAPNKYIMTTHAPGFILFSDSL